MMTTISTVKILKNAPTDHYILYLFDAAGGRYLRIWIGNHEGEQIRLQLEGTPITRTDLPLLCRFLAGNGNKWKQCGSRACTSSPITADYQNPQWRSRERAGTARPSDTVGLALHAGSPIFVDEELMAEQGEALPNGVTVERWFTTKDETQTTRATYRCRFGRLNYLRKRTRFTQRARSALQQAIALAQSFGDNYVGTEHLL